MSHMMDYKFHRAAFVRKYLEYKHKHLRNIHGVINEDRVI